MQSKSLGLILYVKPIKDNDLFIKVLSVNDTVLSGLVYGGNSSKKRSTYQSGYFIEFNQIQKNYNSINSINGEIVNPYTGIFFTDKFKSFSLLAIISILNESIYEGIRINSLFTSVKNLINLINENKHWLSNFCQWLFYFLKLLGYGIDYNSNDKKYFDISSVSFQNTYTNNNSILFPHELFKENGRISYESVKSVFIIFESIYKGNNLNKYNDNLPVNYINFKILVLTKLQNIKNE